MSSRTTSGFICRAAASAASPSWATSTSCSCSRRMRDRLSAASTLSSTTRIRSGRSPGGDALAVGCASGGHVAGVAADRDRQPHDELAAAPRPLAARFDLAVVHLDQPLDQGQPDAETVLSARSPGVSSCVNMSNTRSSMCGGMPLPLSATRRTICAPTCRTRERDPAALVGELGGVVEQVGDDLRQPRPVAANRQRVVRQVERKLVAAARRAAAGWPPPPGR